MLENDLRTLRRTYADARDESDPFEKFNRAHGMGAVRDPYPGIAAMRAQGAVHRLNLAALTGDVKLTAGNLMAASEIYAVLGYDAVYEVLRDGDVLVTGHTRHACVDLTTGKPVRMPEELLGLAPR